MGSISSIFPIYILSAVRKKWFTLKNIIDTISWRLLGNVKNHANVTT